MHNIIFYEFSLQPPFWVAHDDDGYWLVPAKDQGWEERTPFIGRVTHLKKIHDFGRINLGLPTI